MTDHLTWTNAETAAAIARAEELNAELDATRAKSALTATRPAPPPATRTVHERRVD